jgi:acyl CoA:acetate/3-ketoacid CoA transferase alpha subunit
MSIQIFTGEQVENFNRECAEFARRTQATAEAIVQAFTPVVQCNMEALAAAIRQPKP